MGSARSTPIFQYFSLNTPFDPYGLQTTQPAFRTLYFQDIHRVLSVPLIYGSRPVGVMQVASNLVVVDSIENTGDCITRWHSGCDRSGEPDLLVDYTAVSRPWRRLLKPPYKLPCRRSSRRIQYRGPPNDEIGQLILAFNQTLSRLENLFNTQRRFLADVGHELRTPLTVIKGNVDLMRRMDEVDEESLTGIDNEVSRLTRLVGDLLLLAQAESGKLPLDWRLIELDTLVLEALQQMSVLARDRRFTPGDIDQVLVCGDQDRLKQVLVNLIGNAIQYTHERWGSIGRFG
jgi:signal transduction histidine kinase